jgi:hypothetical protein
MSIYRLREVLEAITTMLFFNGDASSPTLAEDLAPHEYEN